MAMEGGFHEEFVSILCMHNASLFGNGKALVLASVHGTLAFAAAAKHLRRLFGSRRDAARGDVLIATDLDAP